MKPQYRLLLAALACIPLHVAAQPAPKVFTVDMLKVFEAHPMTKQQQTALRAEEQKASDQLKKIEGEVHALADKLKEQQQKFDDPTATPTQKEAIRTEGQRLGQQLQAKQSEGQQLLQKTQGELQQKIQTSRGQILADIAKAAGEVARRKGGTLVYDRNSMVYADPGYDMTTEVIAEITKPGRPLPAMPAQTPANNPLKGAPASR